jgi:hypothetical protein
MRKRIQCAGARPVPGRSKLASEEPFHNPSVAGQPGLLRAGTARAQGMGNTPSCCAPAVLAPVAALHLTPPVAAGA